MRSYIAFFSMALGIFFIDRALKELFLEGFFWESRCITLGYVLNEGVAFSLFSFLGPWLKWILVAIIAVVLAYVVRHGWIAKHPLALGVLFGAALGNLYDRFVYGGVVDYVYWHCGFDFAVFNFADVMIDFAIFWFIYLHLKKN